jgi:hypothetical protein
VGLAHAGIIGYWGLGGTWLLDTAGTRAPASWPARRLRAAGRGAAGALVLSLGGLVLTAAGLLVQSGLARAGASADHRALAWPACLRDLKSLLWGLFATAALLRAGRRRGAFPAVDPAR